MSIQPGTGYTFTASSSGTTLQIDKPWEPWTAVIANRATHPFKIINVRIHTSGGSSKVRFQVQSGVVNNIVPTMNDVTTSTQVKLDRVTDGVADPPTEELESTNYDSTTKTSYIVMRAGPDATTGDFPSSDDTSNRYPQIIGGNEPVPVDTDTYGFVIIGTITVDNTTTPTALTVIQNVTGSLWGDRLKTGDDTARYYYARI
jgi:hypothetical protein